MDEHIDGACFAAGMVKEGSFQGGEGTRAGVGNRLGEVGKSGDVGSGLVFF